MEIREYENKFKSEIEKHINFAIPELLNKFSTVRQSTEYEDSKLSFDLVYNLNFTVSIRIRKNKYINFNDLTIRYKSKNGGKTEIDKIKEGLAQVYFYAYMNQEESELIKVRIVNVDAIRDLINENNFSIYKNFDGTELAAFKFSDIANKNGAIYKFK